MRRKKMAALATAVVTGAALIQPFTAGSVGAAPAAPDDRQAGAPDRVGSDKFSDNLTMPWQRKSQALREAATEKRLRTGSRAGVVKLARGQYAKTATTGTDRIFTIIAEFGNARHVDYCDSTEEGACAFPSDGTPQRYDGPLHNAIPKPNRRRDNTTNWQRNYNRAHYKNMYFQRMRKFYENQSLGKYSIDGDIAGWVKVPFNEARYGRDFCGDIVCNNTWFLVRDALAYWVQAKLDQGWSMGQVDDYLATFDKQDRYDQDGDGIFDEPDGYVDHFQIVHAGGDQANGDDIQASDAIWSHRWYAQINTYGTAGPEGFLPQGGVQVGEGATEDGEDGDVAIPDNPMETWVGDYTIQPENGGLGVFAHEFAHDLGLPDHYDTSGNTGGAENSVGWWSLMSQSRAPCAGTEASVIAPCRSAPTTSSSSVGSTTGP